MKREFTGVFIPAHIWTSNLLPAEKMLLGEVSALSQKTGWCDASREHFAEWLHCDVTNVTHYVKKLEGVGYLEVSRTPGFRSQMRVKTDRFFVGEVVNPIHGGSEPHSPEIKDKYNIKNKREDTRNFSAPLNTEKNLSIGAGAAPVSPGWNDFPKADTPDELKAELSRFYQARPEDWRMTKEATPAQNWTKAQTETVVSKFCDWAIGEGWEKRKFKQINARLKRWFKEEPLMQPKPHHAAQTIQEPRGAAYQPIPKDY